MKYKSKHLHKFFSPAIVIFWFFVLGLLSLFSFSLTDPNLTLVSAPWFQSFQQFIWHTFFENRVLLSQVYSLLLVLIFIAYGGLLYLNIKAPLSLRSTSYIFAGSLVILLFSYNALSHDVFNYLFNAKIVLEYGSDPHTSVALDFSPDPWLRFMHNVHTPAPYGYGWTAISLLPSVLGSSVFLLTWLNFRIWSVLSLLLLWILLQRMLVQRGVEKTQFWLVAVVLNPLVLLEIVMNSHNDLWMIVPAMAAVYLADRSKTKRTIVYSALLLFFSISIKFATVVLLPIWLLLGITNRSISMKVLKNPFFYNLHRRISQSIGGDISAYISTWWPTAAALLLFAPLLSDRSTQFHPWYLTWVIVWLPFLRWKWLQVFIVLLSCSSMFRYVPWLLEGGYTPDVLGNRLLITWVAPVLLSLLFVVIDIMRKRTIK